MKRFQNLLLFGIDGGNYNHKTASHCFTSGFREVGRDGVFEDKLSWDGRTYALSDQRIPIRADKTETEDFLILTRFALAKELAEHGVPGGVYDAVLSVGLPPGHLSVTGRKDRLKAYYQQNLEFQCEDRLYGINVKKVFVCPQGYAGLLAPVTTAEQPRIARPIDILAKEPEGMLIDIGGGTVDVIGLRYGKPAPEYHDSFDMGIVPVYGEINAALRSKTGRSLSESTINNLLTGANVRVAEEEKQMVRERIRQYGDQLLLRLMERQYPLRTSYVVLMGGGSRVIQEHWARTGEFGKLDHIDDIRASAKGFEEMALAALSRQV